MRPSSSTAGVRKCSSHTRYRVLAVRDVLTGCAQPGTWHCPGEAPPCAADFGESLLLRDRSAASAPPAPAPAPERSETRAGASGGASGAAGSAACCCAASCAVANTVSACSARCRVMHTAARHRRRTSSLGFHRNSEGNQPCGSRPAPPLWGCGASLVLPPPTARRWRWRSAGAPPSSPAPASAALAPAAAASSARAAAQRELWRRMSHQAAAPERGGLPAGSPRHLPRRIRVPAACATPRRASLSADSTFCAKQPVVHGQQFTA